jgi:Carboxypeptidase regulatory-like domain
VSTGSYPPPNRGTRLPSDDEDRIHRRLEVRWPLLVSVFLLLPFPVTPQEVPANSASSTPDASSTGIIQGVVTGKDGEVYEGVHVALSPAGGGPAQVQITSSKGQFTFRNVPGGPFTLSASSGGFATKTFSAVLSPGQTFDVPTIVLIVQKVYNEVRVSAAQQEEIAEEEVQIEEKQRILGVVPNFYVSYDSNPVPLSPRQKFALAWKSSIDPVTWLLTGTFAGIEQANNTFAGYGQGMQGYGKRFGANFADNFIGTEIGGAILPVLLKQDPRYFYKGTGTVWARARYAIGFTFLCKGDNMRWQPNYSGILGGLAAGGISNLYYPASDRSNLSVTFENAGIGIAGTAVQNLLQEFVIKKFTPSARKATSP